MPDTSQNDTLDSPGVPPAAIAQGVSIRLLSPLLSDYPLGEFRNPLASIVITPDLMLMVTSFENIETPEDHYSETEFLSPFEVRLLSAVLLSWDTESGMCGFYPTMVELQRPHVGLDLSDPTVLDRLVDEFRTFLADEVPFLELHRPPCVGGWAYRFNEYATLRYQQQAQIFDSIDFRDHLTIRGLGALMKANMVGSLCELLGSACMSLWIAMEASLRMILRELKESGNPNPTPKDAGRFLDDAFNVESDGYFVDY